MADSAIIMPLMSTSSFFPSIVELEKIDVKLRSAKYNETTWETKGNTLPNDSSKGIGDFSSGPAARTDLMR